MKKWEVEADGVTHEIKYKKGFHSSIIVDGEAHKVKSSNPFIIVLDYGISFGHTDCNLVVIGNKADLAVNGVFLGSNEDYKPVDGVAPWVWVLVGISSIGGFVLCGIFGLLIGALMSVFYVQSSLKKKNTSVIITFIICTILQVALMFVVASLRNQL